MPTHLITGAGSGIGSATARVLAARGDDLILLARNPRRAAALEESFPDARVVVADLARPEGVSAPLEGENGPSQLDSLLHAAGVVELGPVSDCGTDLWALTISVNLLAPAELTRALLPALRTARGHVVFVNSGAGLSAHPQWSAYAASKFGLRALADALRAEERDRGVRVTSVYPGRTATPMQEKVHRQEGREYDAGAWIAPETVAAAIVNALDLPRDGEVADVTVRPGPG
jgi:short-subunit dehydrogenase